MPYKQQAVTVCLYVWDSANGQPKTGNAASIVLRAVGDGTEFTPGNPAIAEVDSTNFPGVYKVSLSSTENNFTFVMLGGTAGNATLVMQPVQWTNESDAKVISVTAGGIAEAGFNSDTSKYQAKVWMFDDDSGSTDRYVVCWFKNGQPITSGISGAILNVIKVADGTDLIASTAMTQIAATGLYRFNSTTQRIVDGTAYVAIATATIDSSTRTWNQPVGRDS